MSNMIMGVHIEYTSYYPEIYFFNTFVFAYDFIRYIENTHLLHKIHVIAIFVLSIMSFLFSTCIYAITFNEQLFSLMSINKSFIFLITLTLLNSILNLELEMALYVYNLDRRYPGNRYKKDSENRYERYLLERIDEKLNSIKNSKSEKSEEESNDIIDSEELLNGSDILAEMLKNHIEIQEYFQISKNQSKFSFYFSIVSSVVGIIVVIIAASGIVIFKSLGISIIAAVSGAITEIISGIVLWIHNKSALQLNYYYDSLHENEKFLSAVNIADKLSEEKKEDMYIEIIRKQIDIRTKDKENKTSDTDKQ